MKIGILSRNRELYSTRRLSRSAWQRGHQVRVIDTTRVAVHMGSPDSLPTTSLLKPGSLGLPRPTPMPALDAIIPRIGASVTFYGLAVVRQFEAAGLPSTASSAAIAASRDKLQSLQLMTRAGLPIPRTAIVASGDSLFAAVHAIGGLPVVVKEIRGTQGRGIILAERLEAIALLVQRARVRNRQVLLQEYIAESHGRDMRVIVVGGQCVAAMERRATDGEFRANLHQGGQAVELQISSELSELAVTAAAVHGLDVAGVDLMLSDRGLLVLEVNSSPGLEGIETVTGIDVAGAIIGHLERLVTGRRRSR